MNKNNMFFAKKNLCAAIVNASKVALLFGAVSVPVWAQKDAAGEIEEVTVFGQRGSIESAQNIKRESDTIVDSIVSDDIGKLPDTNVAETLQRITGVQITRNKGEGSDIMIRGLTQVRGELNGRDIFTASGGRGLSWEDVPSDLLGGVDVYKNPNAELIEGGIGGLVNLRTRMPFDDAEGRFGLSLSANHWDLRDETKPSISALISERWDTSIGEIGVLANFAYQDNAYREDSVSMGGYYEFNDVPGYSGTTVMVPDSIGMYSFFGNREREGYALALQWAPNEDTEFYFQGLRSDYNFANREYSVRAGNFNNNADDFVTWSGGGWGFLDPNAGNGLGWENVSNPWQFSDSGEFERGTFTNAVLTTTGRYDWRNSITSDYSLGGKWQVNDQLHLSTDFQYVDATTKGVNYWVDLLAGEVASDNWVGWNGIYATPPITVDITGSLPTFNVIDTQTGEPINDYVSDIANYSGWYSHLDKRDDNEATQFSWRGDLRWDFVDSNFLRDVRLGVRYTDRSSTTRMSTWNWQKIPDPATGNAWASFTGVSFDAYPDATYQVFPFTDHFRGKSKLPAGYVAHDDMVADYENTVRMFGHDPVSFSDVTDIREYDENTYAMYAMVRFGDDAAAFPWDANAGVRLVRTETEVNGWARDQANLTAESFTQVATDSSYNDALPSVNFRMFLTDTLQWRMAASRAMSRPDFDLLDPYVTLDNSHFAYTTGGVRYATRGNPELKPMYANQFDTSLEWYFSPGSMVWTTFFYKDISGFYSFVTETMPWFDASADLDGDGNAEGAVLDFETQTRVNGDDGKVKGIELGYRQFLEMLPAPFDGIGFEGNYTYTDSEAPAPDALSASGTAVTTLPLEGLSKKSYNFSLMYEKDNLSIRAAYNWRDDWLSTTRGAGTGHLPVYEEARGQLDASIRYNISEDLSVTFDATNLLDTEKKGYYYNKSRPNAYVLNDRRYGLTLRWNIGL